uniref:Uncharacterized protein n=1 Tax=Anopheles christyi TaxID=43041 RepID=A0A182KJ57_9DIPT
MCDREILSPIQLVQCTVHLNKRYEMMIHRIIYVGRGRLALLRILLMRGLKRVALVQQLSTLHGRKVFCTIKVLLQHAFVGNLNVWIVQYGVNHRNRTASVVNELSSEEQTFRMFDVFVLQLFVLLCPELFML